MLVKNYEERVWKSVVRKMYFMMTFSCIRKMKKNIRTPDKSFSNLERKEVYNLKAGNVSFLGRKLNI